MAIEKIKPNARMMWTNGNDGRDGHYYICYTCPKCNKPIDEGDIACDECGTFFDWTERAHIKYTQVIEWR